MNMAQLMENAEVADDLIQGKRDEDGFKTRRKETQGKQFSAKGNVTSRLTVPPFKKKPFVGRQRQGFKRHFTGKTIEERKALRDAKKCYTCEGGGHFANGCPQRSSQNKDDKSSAGLVPDLVGDQQNVDATELCRAWGKARDQEVLVFFNPGARANFISPELASKLGIRAEEMGMNMSPGDSEDKEDRKGKKPMAGLVPDMVSKANFISPELASKLGIRPEEMGYTAEAGLACPGHTDAVTPIIGKLCLHIQSYVDAEEFYIMPLDGCDVLPGIPWLFRVQGIMDAYNKKITVQSREKTHILDVKLRGESIPTVSASAITSIMKKHLSAYLVFAREVLDCDESNLYVLDKVRSMFLQQYSDCFSDSLPSQFTPERPEDHVIDLVPSSRPPNRPPYKVSASQQKEVMSQIEELLEKGLIQPSSSPFCSPLL
ncbi:hypothetical protein L7F22_021371 [Adiantum nelumboides]|nr:hypothetical protein [Adiantum nelumboides]